MNKTKKSYELFPDAVITKEISPGKVHPKNKLNNLTGKEWTLFTKSWFIFNALASDLK